MKQITNYVILILSFLLLLQCHKLKINNDSINRISSILSDSVQYYKNALGTKTATVKNLQLEKIHLNKIIINKDSDLKKLSSGFSKVKSVVKYNTNLKIDTIKLKLDQPLCSDSIVSLNRTGTISDVWYAANYKITNDSLQISGFKIRSETTIITGFKRKWLLGEQILTTDVTHSNPYIAVDNLQAVEVKIPEPWFKKWYLWLAAGIAGGFIIK